MNRIFNRILISVIVLSSLTIGFAQMPAQNVKVSGLKSNVIVKRDGRGIPYIEAAADADLYFAQGFVTAQDRLWQMDLLRRVARGETAEIFGKAGLEQDKRWRKLGFAGIAEKNLKNLPPGLRSVLENYARGVNAYIATLDAKTLPPEFQILQYKPREWQPTDTIVIGKILQDSLSTTWQYDLLRVTLSELPKEKFDDIYNRKSPYEVVLFQNDTAAERTAGNTADKKNIKVSEFVKNSVKSVSSAASLEVEVRRNSLSRIGFYAEELAASNNWVISGKRTADGRAMLANDPHLPGAAPGIWYLTHLATPANRVSGVTFPGVPGIVLGHNEFIAWGATNVGPDVQDLYIEEFNAQNQYKTPSGWENPVIRREEIKVRKNPVSPETETEILEVTETRNGVIFVEENGRRMALKWTARDPQSQDFGAFIGLNKAKNWQDFQNALQTYGGATQNFVYADTRGNIGWYAAGKIPIRRTGDGAFPYRGATGEGDWTGYIPFAELPHLYNPAEGFIVTANQRTVGFLYKYPQYTRDVDSPFRARRIYDSIAAKAKLTMDDSSAIQFDVLSIPHSNLAREVVTLNAASPESLETLKNWDGRMSPDSKAALLANEIRDVLTTKIRESFVVGKDGKPLRVGNGFIREKVSDWIVREKPALWLPKQFADYTAFFKACDAEARENLTKRFGADEAKWMWGELTKARLAHPLAAAPLIGFQFATPNAPLSGSSVTPNVASGVSMRYIASPGNWDATRHVIPLGQSGNPKSPFYKDQFESWSKGVSPVFPFSQAAVAAAAREMWVLQR